MIHPPESVPAALLRGIRAHPADTGRRLIYADWLDDHAESARGPDCGNCDAGRVETDYDPASDRYRSTRSCGCCQGTGVLPHWYAERAEFIRLHCQLAGLPWAEASRHPVYPRVDSLFYSHDRHRDWGGLAGLAHDHYHTLPDEFYEDDVLNCVWRCGFIDAVHCSLPDFMRFGPFIAGLHPVTTWVVGRGAGLRPHTALIDAWAREYWWCRQSAVSIRSMAHNLIPDELFDLLEGRASVEHSRERRNFVCFDTELEAWDALQQGCRRYAAGDKPKKEPA